MSDGQTEASQQVFTSPGPYIVESRDEKHAFTVRRAGARGDDGQHAAWPQLFRDYELAADFCRAMNQANRLREVESR